MKKLELTGKEFGRLTVISEGSKDKHGHVKWLCQCKCGNTTVVAGTHLVRGCIISCGCYLKEVTTNRNTTHGKSKSRLYTIWNNMRMRCNNPNSVNYKDYGGRGILVCSRWNDSFENFFEDIGKDYSDELTLERVDLNGNYEKANCVWIPPDKQPRNKGKYRNNTSGTTGVRLSEGKRWIAFWRDLSGKSRTTGYSISKYGDELARFLAEEKRDVEIHRLNMCGAGYSLNHGKFKKTKEIA